MYELDSNRQMKDSLDKGWLFIPWVGEVSVKISRIRHHDFIWDFMQFYFNSSNPSHACPTAARS